MQVFTLAGMVWVPIIMIVSLDLLAIQNHRDSLALSIFQTAFYQVLDFEFSYSFIFEPIFTGVHQRVAK